MRASGSALKLSFPGQQDLKRRGTEFPVLVTSLVTFWLNFNKTFTSEGPGTEERT